MIILLMLLAPPVALKAHYLDAAGATHELRLWRDGAHLRRDSDDQLQIFVDDEQYTIIDRARGRLYHAGRASLGRIGSFPDVATLSTLGRPVGLRLSSERTAVGACRWFGDDSHRVCWSQKWQLALIVAQKEADTWHERLRVDSLSASLPQGVFQPPTGLTVLDLDQDLGD